MNRLVKQRSVSMNSFSFNLSLPVVKEAKPGCKCNTPEQIAALLQDTAHLAQEAFTVVTLNRKYGVLDRHLITLGILDASLVHPREVFRPALLDGAAAIVISHNLCEALHKLCYVKRILMCSERTASLKDHVFDGIWREERCHERSSRFT